jgi:hypothetical protein
MATMIAATITTLSPDSFGQTCNTSVNGPLCVTGTAIVGSLDTGGTYYGLMGGTSDTGRPWSNYTIISNVDSGPWLGLDTFVNAPSSTGSIHFRVGNTGVRGDTGDDMTLQGHYLVVGNAEGPQASGTLPGSVGWIYTQGISASSGTSGGIYGFQTSGTAITGEINNNTFAILGQMVDGGGVCSTGPCGGIHGIGRGASSGGAGYGILGELQPGGGSAIATLVAAVAGDATAASGKNGVHGIAVGTGSAVYGTNTNTSGWAGNFNGRVQVNGAILPLSDNANSVGNTTRHFTAIYATNGTIQTSDIRLKKDVVNLSYGIDDILKLHPIAYRWNSGPDSTKHLGLIAQEVEKVLPEIVVHGDHPSDALGITYEGLLPVVIRGLQEQQRIIEAQEGRIKSLERSGGRVLSSFWSESFGGGLAIGIAPVLWVLMKRRKREEQGLHGEGL